MKSYLKELGLIPSESTTNPEIQLLSGVHRESLILVGKAQVVHGPLDVSVGDSTEMGSEYCLKTNNTSTKGLENVKMK